MHSPQTYEVKIGYIKRDLPIVKVAPGVKIAILDILGDVQLTEAAAVTLHRQLRNAVYDYIVTPAVKSIPLAFELARRTRSDYVVLRKEAKIYLGNVSSTRVHSITTGHEQYLYLSERDANRIMNKDVLLLDDVVSTGATMEAMEVLMTIVGANIVGRAAIAIEGKHREDVTSIVRLPVWERQNANST